LARKIRADGKPDFGPQTVTDSPAARQLCTVYARNLHRIARAGRDAPETMGIDAWFDYTRNRKES
jgi:hypothetical protein